MDLTAALAAVQAAAGAAGLTTTAWILALVAAVLVGLGKGGLPVVGMMSVPVLSLAIPPVQAAGLLLPVYVVSDMFGVYAWRRAFDRRVLGILMPASLIGILLGWATASVVPERLVGAIIGLIGASFALSLLLRRRPPAPARAPRIGPGVVWGALTGFTSFVSHAGAPPYQIYVLPLRLEKAVYAGTTTFLFAWINAVKLVPYWTLGQLGGGNLAAAMVLMLPATLAVYAGYRLIGVIPQAIFFKLVTWALLGISLMLIWTNLH